MLRAASKRMPSVAATGMATLHAQTILHPPLPALSRPVLSRQYNDNACIAVNDLACVLWGCRTTALPCLHAYRMPCCLVPQYLVCVLCDAVQNTRRIHALAVSNCAARNNGQYQDYSTHDSRKSVGCPVNPESSTPLSIASAPSCRHLTTMDMRLPAAVIRSHFPCPPPVAPYFAYSSPHQHYRFNAAAARRLLSIRFPCKPCSSLYCLTGVCLRFVRLNLPLSGISSSSRPP